MTQQCIINCIRKNIIAEQQAIIDYDTLIESAKNISPGIIRILTDIRDEEIKHTGQLQIILDKLCPQNEQLFCEGIQEGLDQY